MDEYENLSHTKWECKYHVVFIPKYRRKVLFERLLMVEHVHMMLSIPPKLSVSHVVGYIKGKSAIHIARIYEGKQRNYVGHHFWARGYFVSTVGRDETMIRECIRNQEKEDKQLDQLLLTK